MGYIYCITNLINSKKYIGKTTSTIDERWKEHCQDYKKERCEKRPLYDAFNKYGIENFKIECLEEIKDNNLLSNKEIYWINELQTYGSPYYCYNVTAADAIAVNIKTKTESGEAASNATLKTVAATNGSYEVYTCAPYAFQAMTEVADGEQLFPGPLGEGRKMIQPPYIKPIL